MSRLPGFVKPGGTVFLRDGTSIRQQRHEICDRYSELLKANYSAIYRTRSEYLELFRAKGFQCIEDGQVFSEGCPLNKYPETRLRYYIFCAMTRADHV
jgi:hypothetical protein